MTDVIMWPCEMAVPNNLRIGDVVVGADRGERGVVVEGPLKLGDRPAYNCLPCIDDTTVKVAAGTYVVTNNRDRRWTVVPEGERTTLERVQSRALTWKSWCDPDVEDPSDHETIEWALIEALLPEEHRPWWDHEYMDIPWTIELVEMVAQLIDGTLSSPSDFS